MSWPSRRELALLGLVLCMYGMRAVEVDPAAFRAWLNLGLVRVELGKRDEGCAAIAHALAINPQYAAAIAAQRDRCTDRK